MEIYLAFLKSPFFLDGIRVIPNARKTLESLLDKFDFFVVTDRELIHEEMTRNWIETHFPDIFQDILYVSVFPRGSIQWHFLRSNSKCVGRWDEMRRERVDGSACNIIPFYCWLLRHFLAFCSQRQKIKITREQPFLSAKKKIACPPGDRLSSIVTTTTINTTPSELVLST